MMPQPKYLRMKKTKKFSVGVGDFSIACDYKDKKLRLKK